MMDLDGMTRRFLLGESKTVNTKTYLRALREGLGKLKPSSQSQAVLIETLKSHASAVSKDVSSMQEKISVLEERLTVLEESNSDKS